MKYKFLIYNNPEQEPDFGTPEFDDMIAAYFAANEQMKADGVLVAGEGLQGVETATSVKIKSGKVELTDGPFEKTREHLSGYYVVDVPNMETAQKYAGLIPSAKFGTIEVRPLMDFNPAG